MGVEIQHSNERDLFDLVKVQSIRMVHFIFAGIESNGKFVNNLHGIALAFSIDTSNYINLYFYAYDIIYYVIYNVNNITARFCTNYAF